MPFALPNCGLNGFYVGMPSNINSCHGQKGLYHFDEMVNYILGGNITPVYFIVFFILLLVISTLFNKIKIIKLPRLKNIFYRNIVGKLKPFDELLWALKKGIIHPKTFWSIIIF